VVTDQIQGPFLSEALGATLEQLLQDLELLLAKSSLKNPTTSARMAQLPNR
jgi:hypothetical protein